MPSLIEKINTSLELILRRIGRHSARITALEGSSGATTLDSLTDVVVPAGEKRGFASYFNSTGELRFRASTQVDVRDYGAVGDGTTNDTPAFILAQATGKDLFVPGGYTFLLNTSVAGDCAITLNDGQSVYGEGETSIIKLQANRRGFRVKDNTVIQGLKFIGSGKTNNQTFEGALLATNDINWTIRDCVFQDISGANTGNGGGCIIIGNLGGGPTNWKDGGNIINCRSYNSAVGINFDQGGEYITIIGSKFTYCTTGVSMRSGNIKFVGCNIDNNTTGLIMTTGSNDAHGGFTECTFNHNTTTFTLSNITQGHRFNSCAFYGGNASMTSCVGVRFVNCDFQGASGAITITLTTVTNSLRAFCRVPTTGNSVTFSGTGMTAVNDLDF